MLEGVSLGWTFPVLMLHFILLSLYPQLLCFSRALFVAVVSHYIVLVAHRILDITWTPGSPSRYTPHPTLRTELNIICETET